MKSYKPYWPETTIFWGAGATAQLGIPTTFQQGKYIWNLASDHDTLKVIIDRIDFFKEYSEEVHALLIALGDGLQSELSEFSGAEIKALNVLFPDSDFEKAKRRAMALRQIYDWDALKRIIKISPSKNGENTFLMDLFNILDMHILSGQGLYTEPKKEAAQKDPDVELFYVQNYRLRPARNCLVMLINLQIYCAYQTTIKKNPQKFNPYIQFAEELARLMVEEGIERCKKCKNFADRKFYLFSYSFISLNFDPLIMWLLFNAHKKVNQNPPYIGKPARPMKLFHDFGHFMGIRKIESDLLHDDPQDPAVWYPFNEAAAQRINDPEHTCDRVVRLGKFYFPHGCCCWRECPHCGKLTAYLGDEWDYRSPTLFPSPIIPKLIVSQPRSKQEEDARQRDIPDAVQCAYCGAITRTADIPMVMQSSFKGNHPSFIEEIQRDLKVCLEKTKHIVLLGYSLPPDDLVWRTILATRKSHVEKEKVRCSVVVGCKGQNQWLQGEALKEYVASVKGNKAIKDTDWPAYGILTIEAAMDIFGDDNVRAYTAGIPGVWGTNTGIGSQVKNLLDWNAGNTK